MGPREHDQDTSVQTEKKVEQKYDDPIMQAAYERHVTNIGVKNAKRKADLEYYSKKLSDMCQATYECINSDTTPEELVNLMKIGNKEWLSICARTRKTNKNLGLNTEAYMKSMVDGLQRRMVLTDKKSVDESGEAKEFVLTDPLVEGKIVIGIDVLDKEMEKGIDIENMNPLKDGEVQEFTDEEKQEAIEAVSDLNKHVPDDSDPVRESLEE